MKFTLTAFVMIMTITCALEAKAPNPPQVIDAGSFGVFVNGRRVATETFKIEQKAGGSTAKSELKVEDGSMQRSEMELTDHGDIVRYGWQQEKPTKAELSVVPKDEFLTETINTGPNQKTFSVPHLMPHSTPILDDNFFMHREILIWRYLALGCTSKPEGLSCNSAPQQFGVLIPTQHASEIVTVDFKGKEKISLKGKDLECSSFRLHTEETNLLIYMDDQKKVVRMLASASGLEVVRD
ncbi:MAG: hypothetical protein DMG60_20320 [Acidobacteria bacterium]|nr:MAG: hypothetical protein DMG60_20320 [Acidobacteriota bacterium]